MNFQTGSSKAIDYRPFKTTLEALETKTDISMEVQRYVLQKSNWTENNLLNVQCNNPDRADKNVLISVGNYVVNCTKRCLLTAPRIEMCSNMKEEIVYNIQLTFWLYLAIRVFIGELFFNFKYNFSLFLAPVPKSLLQKKS